MSSLSKLFLFVFVIRTVNFISADSDKLFCGAVLPFDLTKNSTEPDDFTYRTDTIHGTHF